MTKNKDKYKKHVELGRWNNRYFNPKQSHNAIVDLHERVKKLEAEQHCICKCSGFVDKIK